MNRGGVLLLLYISIVVVCLLLLETRALAPTLKAKENNHNNDTSDVLERLRGVEQKVYEQGIQLSEYGADIRNLVNIGNEIKKEVKENKIELMTYIDKATSELKNEAKENKIELKNEIVELKKEAKENKIELKKEAKENKIELKKEAKENKIELMTYIDKATSELKNDFKELSNDLNLIKILLLGIIAILSKDNLFDFVVNLFKK